MGVSKGTPSAWAGRRIGANLVPKRMNRVVKSQVGPRKRPVRKDRHPAKAVTHKRTSAYAADGREASRDGFDVGAAERSAGKRATAITVATTGGHAAAAMPSGRAWRVGFIRVVGVRPSGSALDKAGRTTARASARCREATGRGRGHRIEREVVVRRGASRGGRASHGHRCLSPAVRRRRRRRGRDCRGRLRAVCLRERLMRKQRRLSQATP